MPAKTFKRPYQPVNKCQGGGVPKHEGPSIDARIKIGGFMQAIIENFADDEGISQSAFMRNLIREGLQRRGVTFRDPNAERVTITRVN